MEEEPKEYRRFVWWIRVGGHVMLMGPICVLSSAVTLIFIGIFVPPGQRAMAGIAWMLISAAGLIFLVAGQAIIKAAESYYEKWWHKAHVEAIIAADNARYEFRKNPLRYFELQQRASMIGDYYYPWSVIKRINGQ